MIFMCQCVTMCEHLDHSCHSSSITRFCFFPFLQGVILLSDVYSPSSLLFNCSDAPDAQRTGWPGVARERFISWWRLHALPLFLKILSPVSMALETMKGDTNRSPKSTPQVSLKKSSNWFIFSPPRLQSIQDEQINKCRVCARAADLLENNQSDKSSLPLMK